MSELVVAPSRPELLRQGQLDTERAIVSRAPSGDGICEPAEGQDTSQA